MSSKGHEQSFLFFLQSFYFSLGETSIEPSYDCVRGIIKDFGFEIMVREMFKQPSYYIQYTGTVPLLILTLLNRRRRRI